MAKPVTDPQLLAQLNAQEPTAPVKKPIDPAILAQLNGEKPPEEGFWAGMGHAAKNVAEGAAKLGTGMVGSTVGNIAGLGALGAAAIGDAVTGEVGGSGIDPAAVQQKVAGALTYQPNDPDSLTSKIVDAPGRVIQGAGEGLANITGTSDIPLVGDVVRAVPLAAASLFGLRAPETAAPKPAVAKAPLVKKLATQEELHQGAVDTLLKNDVRLTTEQRGTSMGAKQAGSLGRAADTLLGKSKLASQQLQDFTRAVFNKVGVKADNATADAMLELKRSTKEKYDAAHAGLNVPVDADFVSDLSAIDAKAQRNPAVGSSFDKMLAHIKGQSEAAPTGPRISAKAAEEIRHELGLIENSTDSNIKAVASDVKDALDAATERGATPEQLAKLKEARGQYHFMRQIEDAVDTKGGFISPKKLLNVIGRKRNKNEAVYGGGDQSLVELAQAGAKVLPDAVGNSGTAARTMDVMKAAAAFAHPVTAAKTVGAVMGGRLLNEASATRGTAAAVAQDLRNRAAGSSPVRAAVQISAAQNKESEEQKKRRLQAEALRSN